MGCPCKDPNTGEVKIVSAKTKEMVYRSQAPWIQEAIIKAKNQQSINSSMKSIISSGQGGGK